MTDKKGHLDHFGSILSKIDPKDCRQAIDNSVNGGEPIFTNNDLRKQLSPVTTLLRMLSIRIGMTWEKFNSCFSMFAQRTHMATNQRNYTRNNNKRALVSDNAGWNSLETLVTILGGEVLDLSITVRLPDGDNSRIITVSKSDAERILREEDMRAQSRIRDEFTSIIPPQNPEDNNQDK